MTSTSASPLSIDERFYELAPVLAMEIASGLTKPSEVFSRRGFTKEQVGIILNDLQFRSILREAKANWDSADNAEERIKIKAKLALEELLYPHFILAKSPDTPAAARNEAVKTFERLSGLSKPDAAGTSGERFSITINLGDAGSRDNVTIDAPALAQGDD